MSTDFVLNAEARADVGKGASRRLRRQAGKVPAIIYGDDQPTENITVLHKDLIKLLESEAIFSSIITLKVDGKDQDVLLKDLQRHPAKALLLHADFMRVSKSRKLQTKVVIRLVNEDSCVGVKTQGGTIVQSLNELEISCLPGDLPDYIEVDMADVEAGQIIHISDLKLPEGVESVDLALGPDHDQPVVSVSKPRGGAAAAAEGEAEEQEGSEEASEE